MNAFPKETKGLKRHLEVDNQGSAIPPAPALALRQPSQSRAPQPGEESGLAPRGRQQGASLHRHAIAIRREPSPRQPGGKAVESGTEAPQSLSDHLPIGRARIP